MKKTVFITGSSSGFGKETAKYFQAHGWNVIATMRHPEQEQELQQLSNVWVTYLDVQDPTSISETVVKGIEKFGAIDVLINNAGYGLMGVFEAATPAQIQNQFEVNVFGMMHVTQAVLPHMRQQQQGTIINISSFGGMVGLPFGSIYNSSKFAVEGFSEALAHELAPFNIQVRIIEPGGVQTNFRNGIDLIKNDIESYNPLLADFFQRYAIPTKELPHASPQDVAHTIFKAATANDIKLRYTVGADGEFYINLKATHDENAFITAIRDFFIN